jgi:hypothetical protein
MRSARCMMNSTNPKRAHAGRRQGGVNVRHERKGLTSRQLPCKLSAQRAGGRRCARTRQEMLLSPRPFVLLLRGWDLPPDHKTLKIRNIRRAATSFCRADSRHGPSSAPILASYTPDAAAAVAAPPPRAPSQQFHNVSINRAAYDYFLANRRFPERTVLVMQVFEAANKEPSDVLASGASTAAGSVLRSR